MREEIIKEYLEKAKKKDKKALAKLAKEIYPSVFRFFYYRTSTREDAEDLTSEVFVRIVRSLYGQKGNFLSWLFTIARNILVDYYRKKGRLKEISLEKVEPFIPDTWERRPTGLSPEDIKEMTAILTEEQKTVVLLKFVEGLSNDDISQIMHKSVEAVKGLQFRALTTLRKFYKKRLGP